MIKNFETYLKKAQLSHKIMIYLMPIILIGGLVFTYVLPMLEEEVDMLESEQAKLSSNIKRKQPKTVKKKLKKAKSKLLALKEQSDLDKDSLNFLYAKLTNLEVLEFDEKQWTLTLDDILKKSLKLNLAIKQIKNSDSQTEKKAQTIVPKKYVEIIGSGKYSDALKYLNFIESRQFLVDVKNIKIEKQTESKNIDFQFDFTIYGVNI